VKNADADLPTILRRKLDLKGRRRVLKPADVRRAFALKDPYVASRVFAVLAGGGRTVDRDEAVTKLETALASGESRIRFLFELHDTRGRGGLRRDDVKRMLDASLRQNEIRLTPREKTELVEALFARADGRTGRKDGRLDGEEFRKLLKSRPEVLEGMLAGLDAWFLGEASDKPKGFHGRRRFWGIVAYLFTTVPAALWRAALVIGYVALNAWLAWSAFDTYRHAGANLWIQIARAAGALLNLNGALVLVPMLRGILGWLRRTPLSRLLPVDEHIEVHKLFGTVLFFGGLVHTAAHLMNYLTLPVPLEQSLLHTLAGVTGLVALGTLALMWLFARRFIRRSGRFELFFLSHALYGVWFAAMLLHAPHFWMWAGAPLALYLVEWIIQRTAKRHLSVATQARVLPGGVTELRFQRPGGFRYQPGDYVYLQVPALSRFEWHPFTLSSPPEDEKTLSVHVRAAGNWTKALAKLAEREKEAKFPLAVSGPYGTPSNRIFQAKHVVLVGAGIGVTPFASILRSLLARHLSKERTKVETVKFVWLNRGQASFDWFGDLLSDLEEQGAKGFFDLRIYLTNASVSPSGGLARIGMDLVHKDSKRDLTTGLKSKTRFGRPDWDTLFEEFSKKRGPGTSAVFFCGPEALAAEVRAASRHYGFRFRKENF
jgi:predicted ferric reductase